MANKPLSIMCYSKQKCWGWEAEVLNSDPASCPFKEPLRREGKGEKLCKKWFWVDEGRNKEAYKGKLNFGG